MRSILSFLLLCACSDYDLVARQPKEPAVPSMETDGTEPEVDTGDEIPAETDTASAPIEDTGEDMDSEFIPSDECGFLVDQPLGNPDVETESLAIFTNIGDTALEIRQGETARYQFAVTALACGAVDINGLPFWVDDPACADGNCWMSALAPSYLPMYLTNVTEGITYDPYALSQQTTGFFYRWSDDEELIGAEVSMDTIRVNAGSTKILEFEFTATDTIPVGTTITIYLEDSWWTDVATGNDVWDVTSGGTDLAVTFKIVE